MNKIDTGSATETQRGSQRSIQQDRMMKITQSNAIGLAIDFQEKLVPAMFNKKQVTTNAAKLLSGLVLLEIPIMVSRQYPVGLGDSVEEIKLAAPDAFTFDKTAFSCFRDSALKTALQDSGRQTAILCGIEAHICVLQTALDLLDSNWNVICVVDCMDSRKELDKHYGLQRAMQEGARLASVESVLFEILEDASADAFKPISRLIK